MGEWANFRWNVDEFDILSQNFVNFETILVIFIKFYFKPILVWNLPIRPGIQLTNGK